MNKFELTIRTEMMRTGITSVKGLSERTGISTATINRRFQYPGDCRIHEIAQISKVLGISMADIATSCEKR